ncbi:hypothetical protein CS0771_39350 [Catellatospora sp. IY07-71]|nr:hypothetical protein CS0771_39350 [Catellatospora sp. IY07-71]
MTVRLASSLLAYAAERWPVDRREELLHEWQAEAHVLAAGRRDLRLLAYAASLALSRPPRGQRAHDWRRLLTLRSGAALLALAAGPLVAVPLALVSYPLGPLLLPMVALLMALGGLWAGASWPAPRRSAIAVAALLPALGYVVLAPHLLVAMNPPAASAAVSWVWLAVLTGTIVWLIRGPAHPVWTWLLGVTGAAWAAVTVAVWQVGARGWDGVHLDTAYAPLWFPASVALPVEIPLGPVPDPDVSSNFLVTDYTELYPHTLLLIGAFLAAFGYAAARARTEAALEPVPVP